MSQMCQIRTNAVQKKTGLMLNEDVFLPTAHPQKYPSQKSHVVRMFGVDGDFGSRTTREPPLLGGASGRQDRARGLVGFSILLIWIKDQISIAFRVGLPRAVGAR